MIMLALSNEELMMFCMIVTEWLHAQNTKSHPWLPQAIYTASTLLQILEERTRSRWAFDQALLRGVASETMCCP
jgi:hypothetical protein